MFIRKFAAGGPTTFTYMVLDTAGNSVTRKVSFDPTSRNVYYFGSEREDTVSFVETSPGTVQVNLYQVGGRDLPSVRTLTYTNITGGVIAYGQAGPDYIDGSGLTNRPTTIYGGAGSDTLLGGAGNDSLFGASLTGTMKTVDAQNAITGGAGSDYIWTGTNVDMVVASVTSTIQSMNNLNYLVGGLAVGASTRVATASSGIATNSALMATASTTNSSPSLLNLGSTMATSSVVVAPSTATMSTSSSTTQSASKATSAAAKTGTPSMTSSSRPSTGTGSNAASGEVQLPAEEVDAVAVDWNTEADELSEFVDALND
jgi:hypothetical protein